MSQEPHPNRDEAYLDWTSVVEGRRPTNNAERAFHGWNVLREHIDLLAIRETGELYACHDGVWENDGEQVLREEARRMMRSDYHTSLLRELKDHVRADAAVPWSKMGVPRGTVAVRNGLIELETRDIRDLEPADRALSRLPVAYEPEAECSQWRGILAQVTGDREADQIQEFTGYCVAGGEPWLKRALMILGPTDAGKTVVLEALEALFGEEANAGQTPQYLANQRWGIHQLAGKPVNIRHDVDADKIQNVGILKELIDGNPVQAEQKGKDPYVFRPRTRLLFAANRAPQRVVEDEAFWNRWLTVVFPRTIPREEQLPKPELLGELTAELPGILNWALDGLDRLRENGHFTSEPEPWQVRELWERFGSPVERFKATCLVKEKGAKSPKEEVYGAFILFCIDNRLEAVNQSEFTAELTKDPEIGEGQVRVAGDRPRVYKGVRLAGEAPEPDEAPWPM